MKKPGTTTRPSGTVRCAIYTRKSSEEGLEQEFNSLQGAARGLRGLHRQPAARGLAVPARGL
jgi:site-specific DNA recombinase